MAWLGTWAHRRKITIDHTKFSADVTQFPLPIYISASCGKTPTDCSDIFTELGANHHKLAVTKTDGTTELYAEIEKWDNTNKLACLWVSKSDWTVTTAADIDIYIYFDAVAGDNANVKDMGTGSGVWDANYDEVHHMAGTAASVGQDSSNDTGTPSVTSGQFGGSAYQFNGSNILQIANGWQPSSGQNFTVEVWHRLDSVNNPSYKGVMSSKSWGAQNFELWMYGGAFQGHVTQSGGAWNSINWGGSPSYITTADTNFHYLVLRYNRTGNGIGYTDCDGTNIQTGNYCNGTSNLWDTTALHLGGFEGGANSVANSMDEVRVSHVLRSTAYLNGTYAAFKDTVNTIAATEDNTPASSIKSVGSTAIASVGKVMGVAKASISKIIGLT